MIEPASILFTVTVTTFVVADKHEFPFDVDIVVLLYCVIAVTPAATSYVASVALPIIVHAPDPTFDSHL